MSKHPDYFLVERFLPYRVNIAAGLISQGLARRYASFARRHGIGVAEFRIVSFLGQTLASGQASGLAARDVGARTLMQKVKVSRAIAALERAGLLRRQVNANDRREALLALTAAGHRLYAQMVPIAREYERWLLEGLSLEQIAVLDRVLEHLGGRARDARPASRAGAARGRPSSRTSR